jgi:hypothetical protein
MGNPEDSRLVAWCLGLAFVLTIGLLVAATVARGAVIEARDRLDDWMQAPL